MKFSNLLCVSCNNQLMEVGSLLGTAQGPFILCDVCRTLYYIDVITDADEKPLIVVQPAKLNPEEEFDIIRYAQSNIPLKEYLPQQDGTEERNINPHFQKDLKLIINSSTTPGDLIRNLHETK